MDNVQIWSRALSAAEVLTYMNTSPSGDEANLEIFYDFEEGTGTTAYDYSPNQNHGNFVGASYDNTTISPVIAACYASDTIMVTLDRDSTSISITSCDSYDWYGQTYSNSGTYHHTLSNTNGCDSVLTLSLSIENRALSGAADTTHASATYFSSSTVYLDSTSTTEINGLVLVMHTALTAPPTINTLKS
jgi:hypothetical protein